MGKVNTTNPGVSLLLNKALNKKTKNNLAQKIKTEFGSPKTKMVKIKALVDIELSNAIEYIASESKKILGTDSKFIFGLKVLENNRKFILALQHGMQELLESEQEDEQTEVQNGAEKWASMN